VVRLLSKLAGVGEFDGGVASKAEAAGSTVRPASVEEGFDAASGDADSEAGRADILDLDDALGWRCKVKAAA